MPTGAPPVSHPDGRLVIYYGVGSSTHEAAFYMLTVSHSAPSVSDITDIAAVLAPLLAPRYSITGWSWQPSGSPLPPPTPFASAIPGTSTSTAPDSESWTWTKSGRGTPASPGDAAGKCKLVLCLGKAALSDDTRKYVDDTSVPQLATLTTFLNNPAKNIVNKYGQSAVFYSRVSVQYNSRLQRKRGT